MAKLLNSCLDGIDTFFAWMSASLKQTTESYCELESADSTTSLVAHDGSLISVIRIAGVSELVGNPEFERLQEGIVQNLRIPMARYGHSIQVFFSQDRSRIQEVLSDIYQPARQTAKRLNLDLTDLLHERLNYLSRYCAEEHVYFVLWTKPTILSNEQFKQANKEKLKDIRENEQPPFKVSQNPFAAYANMRDPHDAFVRSFLNDVQSLNISAHLLDVHSAIFTMRTLADPEFTDRDWQAVLPGDDVPVREVNQFKGDVSDILWPSLAKQVLPRDAENLDMRTCRVGDRIYASVFIDLFPQDIKPFIQLFSRILAAKLPWRMSFMLDSRGVETIRLKGMLSTILSFASSQNRLISDANNLLKYVDLNTDEAMVRLRVTATTWAPEHDVPLLRTRTSELAKAIESWGSCEVSETCGDAFAGVVSSMLGVSTQSVATASVAPIADVVKMLPITRPASYWQEGALLFRSPDGKPWPFQPGSPKQTTWIDLLYARPGSGKSVLSNAINLALVLQGGLQRLPRIAIIDIGPSSSGLVSLLAEALPPEQRHLVAYHRLSMTPEYSINPFDTQLGCRFPTAQERAFLVNFLTLLTTPLGAEKPYDGMPDLVGMVVDELYKSLADDGNPYAYSEGVASLIDGLLDEIGFVKDSKTTWWEVTDALFAAGFTQEAIKAQRYAVPLLADAASIVRTPAVEDLYGKIVVPTGESIINAFARMISSSVREYPILSRVTRFDLGESRIVSLDLDEVAKSGGEAADRQTQVMYMLARYVLAQHYYLTESMVNEVPELYRDYHQVRVKEILEDPKRIVYDEFHRTAKAQAVRDQVIIDMREGRKWKVQVALISQSVEDFDSTMVEFATSTYILDAGPAQAIEKTAQIFGLSDTAKVALKTRVHGPRSTGATFLALYATKVGTSTQLLTLTLGPIELWAFSTTADDANIRNRLYHRLGPKRARKVLAQLFPSGSVGKVLDERLAAMRDEAGIITDDVRLSMLDALYQDILDGYARNPDLQTL